MNSCRQTMTASRSAGQRSAALVVKVRRIAVGWGWRRIVEGLKEIAVAGGGVEEIRLAKIHSIGATRRADQHIAAFDGDREAEFLAFRRNGASSATRTFSNV
jgi:hypothetical protein